MSARIHDNAMDRGMERVLISIVNRGQAGRSVTLRSRGREASGAAPGNRVAAAFEIEPR